ncbi:30S ribosomal protein S4e [Candidatus Woesearchaeota archaeon]|nr:30S ribosomal protein S4e [Candidatus Woesearchaeota archaeon]
MTKSHLKRPATPTQWSVKRRLLKFVVRPNPGAQKMELSVPLGVLLRDVLNKVKTIKEAKYLLKNNQVLVDGKRRYNIKYPVGFMDVVTLTDSEASYRIVLSTKGKLFPKKINEKESKLKLSKIENIVLKKGGVKQLNLFGGRNILIDVKEKNSYKTGDSLVLELPSQKIVSHQNMKAGVEAFVFKGIHTGVHGSIQTISDRHVTMQSGEGKNVTTNKQYLIVLPADKKLDIMAK